jgi:hypothetical protein
MEATVAIIYWTALLRVKNAARAKIISKERMVKAEILSVVSLFLNYWFFQLSLTKASF